MPVGCEVGCVEARLDVVIDLECADCTTIIDADGSADWFDLVGTGL